MDTIDRILTRATTRLQAVHGIEGIVLGGSRARCTNHPDSDVDIGIYYEAEALDLPALDKAAMDLDDEHRQSLIAPPGGWGNWVNGGGWLVMDGMHVDLITHLLRVARPTQPLGD